MSERHVLGRMGDWAMMRLGHAAAGLGLSLAFWCVLGAWSLSAQDKPADDGGFVGVKGPNKTYHRPNCALVKRVTAKSKVELADLVEAETEGYRPCTLCKPNSDQAPMNPNQTGKAGAVPGKKGATSGKAVSNAPGIVFSRDVAPVLVANCSGCHEGPQAKKQFDLSTFNKLMKGSPTGKVIEPRDPGNSELLLRVKGESQGRKMPPGNNNDLAEATIEKLETWVREGALLDGGLDPNANLKSYAPTPEDLRKAEIARMNPEQRDQLAETKGRERLKKASSAIEVEKQSSPHFVLLSTLPKERGDALLKGLESRVPRLKALLGPNSVRHLEGPIKIGVYVFKEVNPYAEFVRAVENRELEAGSVGHARLEVEAPYVVAIDPLGGNADPNLGKKAAPVSKSKTKKADEPGGERSLEGIVTEKLADDATRKLGKVPGWLASGVGAWFAAQADPRARHAMALRANAYQQLQLNWQAKVNDSIRGESDLEAQRAIGLSLVEWLMTTNRGQQLSGFIQTLAQPADNERIEDVIKNGWGVEADEFYDQWGYWVRGAYGRSR